MSTASPDRAHRGRLRIHRVRGYGALSRHRRNLAGWRRRTADPILAPSGGRQSPGCIRSDGTACRTKSRGYALPRNTHRRWLSYPRGQALHLEWRRRGFHCGIRRHRCTASGANPPTTTVAIPRCTSLPTPLWLGIPYVNVREFPIGLVEREQGEQMSKWHRVALRRAPATTWRSEPVSEPVECATNALSPSADQRWKTASSNNEESINCLTGRMPFARRKAAVRQSLCSGRESV